MTLLLATLVTDILHCREFKILIVLSTEYLIKLQEEIKNMVEYYGMSASNLSKKPVDVPVETVNRSRLKMVKAVMLPESEYELITSVTESSDQRQPVYHQFNGTGGYNYFPLILF